MAGIWQQRELYKQLDREQDAWIDKPRYKVSRQQKNANDALFSELSQRIHAERDRLEALGIIQHVYGQEYRVAPWVKGAAKARAHLADVFTIGQARGG